MHYLAYTYQIHTDNHVPEMEPYELHKAIVYAWICPDGRKYIGAVSNNRGREKRLARTNNKIAEALKKYPEETWKYEILAQVPIMKANKYLNTIEQMYIDMYQTMDPRYGFNILHADHARTIQDTKPPPLCLNTRSLRAVFSKFKIQP